MSSVAPSFVFDHRLTVCFLYRRADGGPAGPDQHDPNNHGPDQSGSQLHGPDDQRIANRE
jgi:hypothetical protein